MGWHPRLLKLPLGDKPVNNLYKLAHIHHIYDNGLTVSHGAKMTPWVRAPLGKVIVMAQKQPMARRQAQVLQFKSCTVAQVPRSGEFARHQLPRRRTACVLAVLLGWLGAHKVYLGHTAAAVLHGVLACVVLVVGMVAEQWLPAMVYLLFCVFEGLCYLSRSDAQFQRDYVDDGRCWF